MLTHASLCSTRHGASSDFSRGTHGWSGSGSGLLALAGGRTVCLYDVALGQVLSLLGGHGVSVRAVRWLHQPTTNGGYGDETELASCGGDGLIKVWRITHQVLPAQCGVPWEQCGTLEGHSGAVATLATLHLGGVAGGGGHVLASAGIDSTLRLWHRPAGRAWEEDGRSTVVQAFTTLRCPAESVALSRLPDYHPLGGCNDPLKGILIAAGGTDCRVHLYTPATSSPPSGGEGNVSLTHLASLQGHGNWIRSLAFSAQVTLREHFPHQWLRAGEGRKEVVEEEEEEEGLLLASAAQDGKCRLWRVKCGSNSGSSASSGGGVMEVGGMEGVVSSISGRVRGRGEDDEDDVDVEEDDSGGKDNQREQLHGSQALEQQQQHLLGEGTRLCVGDQVWYVTSDALLTGHTGWVTHVSWAPPQLRPRPTHPGGGNAAAEQQHQQQLYQPPVLLSSSMDKSVLIWSPAPQEATPGADSKSCSSSSSSSHKHRGVWLPIAKLTPTGEDSGSGKDGSSLGLTGVYPSPSAMGSSATMNVCVTNIHGALCAWSGVKVFGGETKGGGGGGSGTHSSSHHHHLPSLTGHRSPITSLSWSPCATYLLSTSTDTTCRAWRQHSGSTGTFSSSSSSSSFSSLSRLWVEVSRPMLHGWEVRCVGSCTLRGGVGHAAIVGSAEKVLRVMAAPIHFLEALGVGAGVGLGEGGGTGDDAGEGGSSGGANSNLQRVEYAYVPELGLSAKGVPRLAGGGGGGASGAPPPQQHQQQHQQHQQQQGGALKGPHFSDAHQLDGKDAMPLPLHKASPKPAAAVAPDAGSGADAALPPPLFSLVTGPGAPAGRPSETSLVAHGRWQEVDKLYGHVGEVSCVAVWWRGRSRGGSASGNASISGGGSSSSSSSSRGGRGEGRYALSGGVGKNEGDSAVLLWDIWEGSLLGRGVGHRLTVSAVAWGPSSSLPLLPEVGAGAGAGAEGVKGSSGGDEWEPPQFVFSVGRDRAVGVWGVNLLPFHPTTNTTTPPPALAKLALFTPHKRQVLSLAVAPYTSGGRVGGGGGGGGSGEEGVQVVAAVFATGSRDGVVCIWAIKLLTAEEASAGASAGAGGDGGAAVTPAPIPLPIPSPPHAPSHSYYCVSLGSLPLIGEVKTGGGTTTTTTTTASGMGGVPDSVAVTCLDFCPYPPLGGHGYLLGVGMENGRVEVWEVGVGVGMEVGVVAPPPHKLVKPFPLAHQGSVEALAWKPPPLTSTTTPTVPAAVTTATATAAAVAAVAVESMTLVSGGVDGSIMWWSV